MILMIYQKDTFREYILPNVDNQDYYILLSNKQFNISRNITLKLEYLDSKWKLFKGSEYSMVVNGEAVEEVDFDDEKIILFTSINGEEFQGIVVPEEEAFVAYTKYNISNKNYIAFGKSLDNTISYQFRDLVSKNHGVIIKDSSGVYVEDSSVNGIYINYVRVNGRARLNFGDVINIFGLHIIYLGNILGIHSRYGNVRIKDLPLLDCSDEYEENGSVCNTSDSKKIFNRSPRNIPDIHEGAINIEEVPAPKVVQKKPLLMIIGPSFTMAIPMLLGCLLSIYASSGSGGRSSSFMYTGIITSFGSAIFGIIWALVNIKYTQQCEKADEELRFDSYGNYLIEISKQLKCQYDDNTAALLSMYPNSNECCEYDENNIRLWNRNFSHKDFFFCRLGIGDIPFQVEINLPREKFTLISDNLKSQPELLKKQYTMLKNVPVGIDISEHKLWGIVGDNSIKKAIQIMYNISVQLAANICYTDVKLVYIYDEKICGNKERWKFAKWLPHTWSEDKKTRYIASNEIEAKEVFFELSNIMRYRCEDTEEKKKKFHKPYYVLFIAAPEFLEGEIIGKYIFDQDIDCGMSVFIMVNSYETLPNGCENIIQNGSGMQGIYNTMDTSGNKNNISFDNIDEKTIERFSKKISNIRVNEIENNTDIPNSLDFLEMYGVKKIEDLEVLDKWKKNRTFNTMKALIGKKAGGSDCYLDIHEKYHGPHGLIAGTTGSGKSETLQTYILSLAVNYSPDDVGFFIIDFKGGGMANLFSNLPHLIGQISNLSGNQVRRAMISIKSENMRRQRLFSEYGVNNINLYTRLYKNNETKIPIPHLFIIIDEFAELKREEPDFMRELISVAQVGRSLGVHLILATQKPSGTVDDNIWSNSKFRLCLRVQDRQDSTDMLHKPDAAYITQAGRCYMQVGNDEIYELFQSGWSGAVYDSGESGACSEIATMLTLNGKTALVGNYSKIKRKEEEKRAFYKEIIDIAMSMMLTNGIFDVSKIDESKMNDWCSDITDTLVNMGIRFDNNKSFSKKLTDMLKLWPKESMDVNGITEYIIEKSVENNVRLPEMQEITQLDAVVEYLDSLARENGYGHNLQLWLPVLPRNLYLSQIIENKDDYFDGRNWSVSEKEVNIEISVGLYDDPENQAQESVIINFFETGNLAVCGGIVTGKSTFLQTVIYGLTCKYTSEVVNIYILDFSSGMLRAFETMPHVGGVITENEIEKVQKLFTLIESMLEERKKAFEGGNYIQYIKAYGMKYPTVFLVIDNMANFNEKTDGKYGDILLKLSREGVAYGIFLVLSSAGFGMNEIPNRVADNIKNIVALELTDKFKYMDVLGVSHLNVMPEENIKGRGIVSVNGNILEFQTALIIESEDDYGRAQYIQELANKMSDNWTGRRARKIPEIPEKPSMAEFECLEEVKELNITKKIIPFAYVQKDASIFGIDLSKTYCYLIVGKNKIGKTTLLKNILKQTINKDGNIVIFEKKKKEFIEIAKNSKCKYIEDDQGLFDYFKELLPEFVSRNKEKQKWISEGCRNEEIYGRMESKVPIFVFIADVLEFFTSVYKPEVTVDMAGFIENIIEKGELHNIYFIGVLNSSDTSHLLGYKAYKSFIEYKNGVFLGGNTTSQRFFEFTNISFQEASKSMNKGLAWAVSQENPENAVKIVLPL